MELKAVLREKRDDIVKRWFESVLEGYQEEARPSFRRRNAQFTNPVGFNLAQGLEGMFDGLLSGMMPGEISTQLDAIVRLRAVQDFKPSESVAFILHLKDIVRDALGRELLQQHGQFAEDLRKLDSAVDDLALYAFDLYMQCREKIYDIKAEEARRATFRLLQQAKILTERPD
jgi:hypothetical protein